MLLCIDVGNTNTMLGLYAQKSPAPARIFDEALGPHWRIATDVERMPDEMAVLLLALLRHSRIDPGDISGVALASGVAPLTSRWREVCEAYLARTPLVVRADMRTGLTIRYDPPHAVGTDRIVDAVAAYRRYGGPTCIIDCGTATTFEAITAEGEYLGGAIAPGIAIAADALYNVATALPKVELERPPSVIGSNTVHAMQSGLIFGYVGLVESMIARFRRELGDAMQTVATGGLAPVIARHTDAIEHIEPWLTLEGLRLLYEMNE